MKTERDDQVNFPVVTAPRRLAEELLPLLEMRSLKETPQTLRQLVEPSPTDLKVLQTKLGAAAATRVRESRQRILVELNALLREGNEHAEIRP